MHISGIEHSSGIPSQTKHCKNLKYDAQKAKPCLSQRRWYKPTKLQFESKELNMLKSTQHS